MTKEKFIEILRGLCEEDILFVDNNGEINFYSGGVIAYLKLEGIE